MKLPSDTPKLPKWIFLLGDVVLVTAAWFIAEHSGRPITGVALASIAACVIAGVIVGAFPFIADYARRQDEALDDRQRSLHSLSVTVAASAEQIAIAATGLQGLAEAAQENLAKSERVAAQIQSKMAELEGLLSTSRKDDADAAAKLEAAAKKVGALVSPLESMMAGARKDESEAAARLEAVAKKFGGIVASIEAALAKAAATQAAPQAEPELAPVPSSRITRIKPAALPSESPFVAVADNAPAAGQPELAPALKAAPRETAAPAEAPAAHAPAADVAPATEAQPTTPPAPRKRSPRKPPPAPVEAAPEPAVEAAPAPDGELPLASAAPEATEPAVSADGATRLIITSYIGIGNRLFIRGDGPGLTWEKGVPLSFVSIGKWRWETSDATKAVRFKLFKNDDSECVALGERTIEPGAQQDLSATF
jgi:hypothetical protein